jgi:hypothetical protein
MKEVPNCLDSQMNSQILDTKKEKKKDEIDLFPAVCDFGLFAWADV